MIFFLFYWHVFVICHSQLLIDLLFCSYRTCFTSKNKYIFITALKMIFHTVLLTSITTKKNTGHWVNHFCATGPIGPIVRKKYIYWINIFGLIILYCEANRQKPKLKYLLVIIMNNVTKNQNVKRNHNSQFISLRHNVPSSSTNKVEVKLGSETF